MTAKSNITRPVRIRIDEVQVNDASDGEAGGHTVYKLAAMSDDYALFRKVTDTGANAGSAEGAAQLPT